MAYYFDFYNSNNEVIETVSVPAEEWLSFDGYFHSIKSGKFENAQVISGGVKIDMLNNDLSLKQDKRIYLGGEVIDCDGMCGGYNLQFAFSCAHVISESIKKVNQ